MSVRRSNVLLVDDDPSIVRFVEKCVTTALSDRLVVTSTTDSREAQSLLDDQSFDILLTDIEMPDLDGLSLLRIAKDRNAWTKVIFITGHSSLGRITHAMEQGASDYLVKPLDREQLASVLVEHLNQIDRWKIALKATFAASGKNA